MKLWNVLIGLVIGLTATAAGALVAIGLYGAAQVTRPRRSANRDEPERWGMPCEEAEFSAPGGPRLKAWLARAAERGPAVVVLHGHGGNRHGTLAHASVLFPSFTVLVPDLRGHGESEGQHTSVGYLERLDAIAAVEYLRELGYGPIGVLGISMGAATAILAAADSDAIAAVAADSSFAVLRFAVREGARLRGYPGAVTRPLAYLSCQTAAWRLRYSMRDGDPLNRVAAIAGRPLLLIHGEADDFIRPENAQALFDAAGEPKELWLLPGVGHARALELDCHAYQERVTGFFERWLGKLERNSDGGSGARALNGRTLQVRQPAANAGASQVDQVAQN